MDGSGTMLVGEVKSICVTAQGALDYPGANDTKEGNDLHLRRSTTV